MMQRKSTRKEERICGRCEPSRLPPSVGMARQGGTCLGYRRWERYHPLPSGVNSARCEVLAWLRSTRYAAASFLSEHRVDRRHAECQLREELRPVEHPAECRRLNGLVGNHDGVAGVELELQ